MNEDRDRKFEGLIALGVEDAARVLGVGKVTIFRLLKEGQLRRVKIGRRTLIPTTDIAALAEVHRRNGWMMSGGTGLG